MAKICIAGGTGLIGKALEDRLNQAGHSVTILTRTPRKVNHVAWDPNKKTIDKSKLQDIEVLINLCGESVGEGRWTAKRKKELESSRVETTHFLHSVFQDNTRLKQYLSASGINAYPLEQKTKEMNEEDAFGSDYLSQLVKKWEEAADVFLPKVPVCKLRIAMVLSAEGGALQKLMPLVKFRIASPIGSGNQCMNWVHIDDVAGAFVHAISKGLEGAYNLTGEPVTNRLFMNELIKTNGRKMWAPNVPSFLMKWIMGEQATIVLEGALAKREKFKETGFIYQYPTIQEAFQGLIQSIKKPTS